MKGVIFNLLQETVTRRFSADVWDDLIDDADVPGAYTSLGNYADEELEALVAAACAKLQLDRDAVLRWFGVSAMPILAELYPDFFKAPTARAFVEGVNDIIHAEVRKLYPGATCPHLGMSVAGDGALMMDYRSGREMCALAQGFVEGVAAWYQAPVVFEHVCCTRTGAPHCVFKINWPAMGAAERRAAA